jgi:putative transposase
VAARRTCCFWARRPRVFGPTCLDNRSRNTTLLIHMTRRRSRQVEMVWKTRGGRRKGAGRKRAPQNVGLLPHIARPEFVARVPVHVTLRAKRGTPAMRTQLVGGVVRAEIARASQKGFRVLHQSIQDDHLHLIVEADGGEQLSRGMQRLASRVARAVNLIVGRRGGVWRERYHRRDLATPKQFRNALVYVTFNFRKHAPAAKRTVRARELDGFSSAVWLDDWKSEAFAEYVRQHRERAGPRPTVEPVTWIARVGWKRHGKLSPLESPRSPG